MSAPASLLRDLSESIEAVVRRTSPSVVAVEHARGHGSGIVIAEDGYVITNSHVVRGARELRVQVEPGEAVRADLVGDDPPSDLAVLRLTSAGVPALPLYDGQRLRTGQLVLAIGNPLRFERSVSLGIVSAIDRTLPGPGGRPFEGLVQTDAAINPGSSGGPLLDASGLVVGVNTAIIPMARGLGFAIPAHTVSWVLPVLLGRGRIERPFVGIAAHGFELSPARALDFGQARAVRVLHISNGDPADRAGIRKGDVLLRANGRELGSVDDLVRALVLGEAAELEIELARRGERRRVRVSPVAQREAA